MSVSPFKERFSLGWLAPSDEEKETSLPSSVSSPSPARPGTANPVPAAVDAVFSSIGSQILATLNRMPQQESTLLDLASASSLRFEALLPIMQYLASRGLVKRVREDPAGNDTYRATGAVAA